MKTTLIGIFPHLYGENLPIKGIFWTKHRVEWGILYYKRPILAQNKGLMPAFLSI
jgi:hypothetical protein